MATLSILNRASAFVFKKARTTLLKRNTSTEAPKNQFIEVSQNESNGITTVSMARAPVNSLNLELATELRQSLENIIDKGSKGVILTSSLTSIFSAGLDIMEICKPDIKRCTDFFTSLQDLWNFIWSGYSCCSSNKCKKFI